MRGSGWATAVIHPTDQELRNWAHSPEAIHRRWAALFRRGQRVEEANSTDTPAQS